MSLLENQRAETVLADKGYDADYIITTIQSMGAKAVIPPKLNRNASRDYDVFLYQERNISARMFGKFGPCSICSDFTLAEMNVNST